MISFQQSAISDNFAQIISALELSTDDFITQMQVATVISFAERQLVDKKSTNTEKIVFLLEMLKQKDDSWKCLLQYLRCHNQMSLANKLSADGTDAKSIASHNDPLVEEFSKAVVQHYLSQYANVRTLWDTQKYIDDVWVPLQLEGKTASPWQNDRFDHNELIRRLHSPTANVAVIKGDPGTGKTTLVKKIAYDWAKRSADSLANFFTLVIAIPLRCAGECDDFLSLAVDFFMQNQTLSHIDRQQLLFALRSLGPKILVCLDGLDEYEHYADSPFKTLFTEPFQQSNVNCRSAPPLFSFNLLITSRPYACSLINSQFFPLRFKICPLDTDQLATFVQFYCETIQGRQKVSDYLTTNADQVMSIPLILTFICYLADSDEQIPANITLLYQQFLYHVLQRELREGKLVVKVNLEKWISSKVVKSTARLAARGCADKFNKYEFHRKDMQRCHITNDSFTCGYLLQVFDFHENQYKCEFLHRSVQEFFAALHLYSLFVKGGWLNKRRVNVSLTAELYDSQLRRFFFGICAANCQFTEMLNWLKPTFHYSDWPTLDQHLAQLSKDLADLSGVENRQFGQRLSDSFYHIERQLLTEIYMPTFPSLCVSNYSTELRNGLRIEPFWSDSTKCWCVRDTIKPESLRFAYVTGNIPDEIWRRFPKIQCLVWHWNVATPMPYTLLNLLPPVDTFFLSDQNPSMLENLHNREVVFDIECADKRSYIHVPKHFGFAYIDDRDYRISGRYRDLVDFKYVKFSLRRRAINDRIVKFNISAVVQRSMDQAQLLKTLMHAAFYITHHNVEYKYANDNNDEPEQPCFSERRTSSFNRPLAL